MVSIAVLPGKCIVGSFLHMFVVYVCAQLTTSVRVATVR